VVQLYAGLPAEMTPRPLRELKGFQRVTLKSGESRAVTIPLPVASLRYWHPEKGTWVNPQGPVRIDVGLSERDIRQLVTLPVTGM